MSRDAEGGRVSPWVVAIVVGLTLMAIFDVVYVTLAVTGADPIVESYLTEPR